MANVLAYSSIFQQKLDDQIVAGATSSWMEQNAGQVIYTGGADIKIPKKSTGGLGDYGRGSANAFPSNGVTLSYETKTMTMDRATTFSLDTRDVDETNFVLEASKVMSDFQKEHVIPEIDSYRYSKLATSLIAATRASGGYTPVVADILTKIKADIVAIKDKVGSVPLVITMSSATAGILDNSTELTRQLNVGDFNGSISGKVKMIDDCPIIEVPSDRLKTAYTFSSTDGYVAAAGAKNINWIICPVNAPIAISKQDKVRIFDPNVNQGADAWKIDYRKFHDLFVLDNKLPTMFVNIKEALV